MRRYLRRIYADFAAFCAFSPEFSQGLDVMDL